MAVIGQLDRRIEIQRQVVTRDAFGGVSRRWERLAVVWAKVTQTGVSTAFSRSALTDVSERNAKIKIRWLPGINSVLRVVYQNLAWDIIGVATYGRRDSLVLDVRTDPTGPSVPFS